MLLLQLLRRISSPLHGRDRVNFREFDYDNVPTEMSGACANPNSSFLVGAKSKTSVEFGTTNALSFDKGLLSFLLPRGFRALLERAYIL